MTTPDQVANLEFWYKADAITGLTDGQALNTNATLWPDSGPHGYGIASFAGTNCPTYGATAGPSGSGLPGVVFDGTSYLLLPAAALAAFNNKPGATVYALVKCGTSTHNSYILHVSSGANANSERFSIKHSSSASSPRPFNTGARRLDSDSDAGEQINSAVADNTFNIESGQADWTNDAIRSRIGSSAWSALSNAFTSGGGNSDITDSVAIHIGGNPGVTPVATPMTIVEIFAYSSVPNSTDDAGLLTYLQDRMAGTVSTTVPDAPTNVTAVGGNADAIVSWDAPASDGGATITGYTVTGTPGGSATVSGTTLSATVTGLTNGTSYTFTVHATNSVGNSAESANSNSVVPAASSGGSAAFARETSRHGSNQNTWSITLPAATTAGDILLAVGAVAKGGSDLTEPSDFTLVDDVTTGLYSGDMREVIGWKRAVAGDANSVKTWSGAWANNAGAVLEYSGITSASPFDATPIAKVSSNGSMPGMALPDAGCMLIYGVITGADATITDPPGFTKRVDATDNTTSAYPRLLVYDKVVNAAGTTAPIPATVAGNSHTVAFLIALKPAVTANQPPTANAGADQVVSASSTVTLHGSGSDPNNDTITYSWRQISGTAVTLSSTTVAQPTFTAPATTDTLVFGLTTSDGTLSSAEDTVTVSVVLTPDAPVQLTAEITQNTVSLSWAAVDPTGLSFLEIRRQDPDPNSSSAPTPPATINDGTLVAELAPSATSFLDTGLDPSTDYAYSLFAVAITGAVSSPAVINITTQDVVPLWTFLIGTVDIPAGTTTVKLKLTFESDVAGNEHWIDTVGLYVGVQNTWSRGGIATNGICIVEYSDDNGTTWATVRNGGALTLGTEEFVSIVDYEAPPGGTRMYRAKVQSTL